MRAVKTDYEIQQLLRICTGITQFFIWKHVLHKYSHITQILQQIRTGPAMAWVHIFAATLLWEWDIMVFAEEGPWLVLSPWPFTQSLCAISEASALQFKLMMLPHFKISDAACMMKWTLPVHMMLIPLLLGKGNSCVHWFMKAEPKVSSKCSLCVVWPGCLYRWYRRVLVQAAEISISAGSFWGSCHWFYWPLPSPRQQSVKIWTDLQPAVVEVPAAAWCLLKRGLRRKLRIWL